MPLKSGRHSHSGWDCGVPALVCNQVARGKLLTTCEIFRDVVWRILRRRLGRCRNAWSIRPIPPKTGSGMVVATASGIGRPW